MGEAIHTANNTAAKVDALAEKVAFHTNLPARVDDLDTRVSSLETDRDRRDGAMGFGGWLLKSPIVWWLVSMALAAWALLRTKG